MPPNADSVRARAVSLVTVEGARAGEVLLTCEHAGNRIPEWLEVPPDERAWFDTHWGYDPGAAAVARAVARELETQVVLGEFSRLVCDPNRPLAAETWIRETVEDGQPLSFNQGIADDERLLREELWHRYHSTVDETIRRALAAGKAPLLFSVHTMTHLYVGHSRDMELAVLFSDFAPMAEAFATRLESHGFIVARNEPYSGYEGLIYSVERHGRTHRLPFLEIEVRQDLLDTRGNADGIGRVVAGCLRRLEV